MRYAFLSALLSLPLAACAASASGDAPSLAKRPVEGRFDVAAPPAPLSEPGPLPADLAGRMARWEADAAAGQRGFAAERSAAATLVAAAAGASVASERWIVAQQALSRLVAARAPLTAALADIDRLYLERSVDAEIDGLPDIYALRERLADLVSAQDVVIAALSAGLPGE